MDNHNQVYVSFDADNAGRLVGQAILQDDPKSLKDASERIDHGNEIVSDWAQKWHGEQYSSGGDQGVWLISNEAVNELESIRKDYEYATGMTLSMGVGHTLSESGRALLVAKVKGKNQIVFYSSEIEEEIKKIVEHVKAGKGSTEEQKLAESYIEPTQAHKDNNLGYDSGYKSDSKKQRSDSYEKNDLVPPTIEKPNVKPQQPIKQAVSSDVPEASRPMNLDMPDEDIKEPEIKKPAPKFYHGQSEGVSREPEDDMNIQDQPDEDTTLDVSQNQIHDEEIQHEATSDAAEDKIHEDLDDKKHCASCTCDDHKDHSMEDILDHHIETAKDHSESMEGKKDSLEDLLDDHVENAKDHSEFMDDQGISRPEDYNQKDDDMGLSEEEAEENQDEPGIADVLKEGLDHHASSIKKEKVVQMVGEALEKFKSQKDILDKAKEEAPEFYDACVSMLRSMIELCSLAGVDQSEPEDELNQIEADDIPEDHAPAPADSEEESAQAPQS